MYEFNYQRPATLAEAASLLGASEDGIFMAGGQTLLPTMKQRLAAPSDVIDLTAIDEIKGVTVDGNHVTIGAGTVHAAVAADANLAATIPAISSLAANIGDAQVRNRGTIGGSIANNDPAADYPGAIVGLKSVITTDQREISGDDFFTGMFDTALEEGEIVSSVRFEVPDRAAYAKFPNPASRYAVTGVMVACYGSEVRVAVTGAAPCVFRATDMETALSSGGFSAAALDAVVISPDELNNDLHASGEYRANLVKVMAQRAVSEIA